MHAIKISNLSKTYESGVVALKKVNLQIPQGSFYALLGPNGAGKSTTIGILTQLVNKTSGKVLIHNHSIDTESSKAKELLGIVPQEFNFNIFEKVIDILIQQAGFYGVPQAEAEKRANIILKELGLHDKKNAVSRSLSGGMKRRLMIARALIHHPKILILDEPTAGVDIELRRGMYAFLKKLNKKGTTILLTTHYLEEAEELCDNIAIIDKGKILVDSPKKELLQKLEKEYFILDTKGPIDTTKLTYTARITSNGLEVEVKKEEDLNTLFTELTRQNVKVLSMKPKSNRLEEIFVELTE